MTKLRRQPPPGGMQRILNALRNEAMPNSVQSAASVPTTGTGGLVQGLKQELAPKDQSKCWVSSLRNFCRGQNITEELFEQFMEPELARAGPGRPITYRTVYNYMERATSTDYAKHLRKCQAMKALAMKANLTDGKRKAPRARKSHKKKIFKLIKNSRHPWKLRMGMWIQVARGARASDVSKVRGDGLTERGIYWRAAKNIRKSSQRKNVVLKKRMLRKMPPPPISFREWRKFGADFPIKPTDYNATLVNGALREIPAEPKLTSESLRDIFHRIVLKAVKDDPDEATKYTIHAKDSTMMSSTYAAPRKRARTL